MDTTYNNSYNAMFNIDYSKITINDIDDITIKINNDNKIYVDKLTDNNFNINTISQNKIINLLSDLQLINNNFNNYYNKSESDNKFALITSLNTTNSNVSTLQSYFTSNKLNLTNLTNGSGYSVLLNNNSNILSYGLIDDNYINNISQSKITNLTSNLSTINSNISTLQSYFTSSQLNLVNLNSGNFGSGNNYLVLCSVPNISSQTVQWQQIGDNFIAGGIQQSKILNLVSNLASKVDSSYLTSNYSTTSTNDSRYLLLTQYNIDNINYTYDYAYNNYRDTSTGLLKINVFVPPSSIGTYYLKCVRSAGPINTFSWGDVNTLSFSPYATFQGSSATNYMKLEQLYNPIQTVPVSIEYIASNSYASDYLISIGYNSSGYFGTSNLGSRYGYIYCASSNLRIFNYNGSSVDTALLFNSGDIQINRNITSNGNKNININSGSLTCGSVNCGSISSSSINTNNGNINFGNASCLGNNYTNSSGGSAYFPSGLICNSNLSMNTSYKIVNLANGTFGTDAVNLNQLNSKTISTDYITTSNSGIADGVRLCRGPGGTGDISIFSDNGTSSLLFNGWGRVGWRSVHVTQTYQNRLVISNDRFAFIHGNDVSSGQNAGGYLSEWWYYSTIRAYISNAGTFTNSDINMKHSLRNKSLNDNKDYLERILKLPIYSYAFNNCDDPHCNSEINVGPMYQDIKEIFNNNCIGNRKYIENYKCKIDCGTCKRRKEYYGEEVKCINSSEIFYYHILAFQQYVKKTDKIIDDLKNGLNDAILKINELITIINNTGDVIKSYL